MFRTSLSEILVMISLCIVSCSKMQNDEYPVPEETSQIPQAPELGYDVYPSGGGIQKDTYLKLTFSDTPELGSAGAVRIFTAEGKEVDCIYMEDVAAPSVKMENSSIYSTSMDALQATPGTKEYFRYVNYRAVTVEGNSVIVRPHCNVLEYNSLYYVTIDREAISALEFDGIGAEEWYFLTGESPDGRTEVSVGKDGDTDFRTIQGALIYACSLGQTKAVTINISNGTYEEQLFMRNKSNVTLNGLSRSGVILKYSNCEDLASGVGSSTDSAPVRGSSIGKSGGRSVILFENCDNIRFENMTMENSYSGERSQAEVIYFNTGDGSGRIVFINCTLSSRQDTVNAKGYGWFYDCRIEGNVDFIWGSPETILFEKCEIRTVYDTEFSRGYIVQCRCLSSDAPGFIFLNCDITAESGVGEGQVYLARSSGSAEYYDNVTFAGCTVDSSISSQGWYTSPAPNPMQATAGRGWKEFGSMMPDGKAVDVSGRSSCSRQLTQEEFNSAFKDRETVFRGCPKGYDWLADTI